MASIEKRGARYRVKYRDASGKQHSRTFTRKADADRFGREVEVDKADPAQVANDFLASKGLDK